MASSILIVDDNVGSCQLLARLLRKIGHMVVCIFDGEGAKDAIQRFQPDLVILDVNLPGISGLDVLRLLRREPDFRDMPIIMLTGRTDSEAQQEAFRCGASDYLVKALDWESFVVRIEQQLGQAPPSAAKRGRPHSRDQVS